MRALPVGGGQPACRLAVAIGEEELVGRTECVDLVEGKDTYRRYNGPYEARVPDAAECIKLEQCGEALVWFVWGERAFT